MSMPPGTRWSGRVCRAARWGVVFMMLAAPHAWADDAAYLPRLQAARLAGAELPAPAALANALLADPGSPYSALAAQPSFTNDIAWVDLLESLPGLPGETRVLQGLARELGLTRARPREDVPERAGYRDPMVAANAAKAGVDPDIFWHMLDLGGFRHSARTAAYAIALQELRRQLATVPPARHAANGIDPSVYARMMSARYWSEVTPYDLDYLGGIAQSMLTRGPGSTATRVDDSLPPAAYRVARLAAAWRDTEGYFVSPPCKRDGTPRETVGSGAELCFVAARDRAVHTWYIGELRRQARVQPPHAKEGGLKRLFEAVALFMPLLDIAALAEVVEAAVTDDLAFDGLAQAEEAEAAEQRAAAMTCRLRK